MPKITLKPLLHREQECIGIYFEHNPKINWTIRQVAGARWSQTQKCWWVPLNKENYNKLFFALKGLAEIEQSNLHHYLLNKKDKIQKKTTDSLPAPKGSNDKKLPQLKFKVTPAKQVKYEPIYPVNEHVIPALEQRLKLKGYSLFYYQNLFE
jgi:hypothetical protein